MCASYHKGPVTGGSVFRYVPDVKPEDLCRIFADYDGQSRFVPGLTVTGMLQRDDSLALVYHRINPVTFLNDAAETTWPKWLYGCFTYSYSLEEEILESETEQGMSHSIRWSIPYDKWKPRARENGEIVFTPMNSGTLIAYNNGTEAFGYDLLMGVLSRSVFDSCYRSLGGLAQDYYRRTVENFVALRQTLSPEASSSELQSYERARKFSQQHFENYMRSVAGNFTGIDLNLYFTCLYTEYR